MKVVILAGGRGTRLGTLALNTPKALVEIAGKPIIDHQIDVAARYGVKDFLILTGHLGDQIETHFGDGGDSGLHFEYVREQVPLGTAGAVRAAMSHLNEDFFVFYGDIIFDIDLDRLRAFHLSRHALATLVVHPNDHPYDSDLIEADASGQVMAVHRKNRSAGSAHRNVVNTGLFCMSPGILPEIPENTFLDFGLDVLPALAAEGKDIVCYRTPEYIKDVGSLDRLERVGRAIEDGTVARLNLCNPRPAIFLDRDGVINVDGSERLRPEDVHLLPRVGAAIRRINESGYLAICITNQPGIAKGFLSEADVEGAFIQIDHLLGLEHAYLDDAFICPHHPEAGFPGERVELKFDCDCRKPKPGLIFEAAKQYNVDLSASFMVGDRTIDVESGKRAGVRTILVRTGFGGTDAKFATPPDHVGDDLSAAVDWVLASK